LNQMSTKQKNRGKKGQIKEHKNGITTGYKEKKQYNWCPTVKKKRGEKIAIEARGSLMEQKARRGS